MHPPCIYDKGEVESGSYAEQRPARRLQRTHSVENEHVMMSPGAGSSFSKLARVADRQRRKLLGDGVVAALLFGGVLFGIIGITGIAVGIDLLGRL
jgi:hypothetical protein